MLRSTSSLLSGTGRAICSFGFALAVLAAARCGHAQDPPLFSGGVGFFTTTNAGRTFYTPTIQPLIAAPLGPRLLVESRSILQENFAPKGGGQPGYDHSHFISVIYMQGDFVVSPHFTLVTGYYLIPFNTYNDRLSPIWIGNFQDGPLIASVGSLSTGSGLGGMFSGNVQFNSSRGFGGRASLHLPDQRLEMGLSYDRILQGTHENFYGGHLWWEPRDTAFRLRAEGARGHHAQGTGSKQTTAPRPFAASTVRLAASSQSSACNRLFAATRL